jgi:hypothetical protein
VEEEADGSADGDGLVLDLLGHGVAHDALQVRANRGVVVLPQLRRHAGGGRERRQERRQDPDPGAHDARCLSPVLRSPRLPPAPHAALTRPLVQRRASRTLARRLMTPHQQAAARAAWGTASDDGAVERWAAAAGGDR